MSPEQVTEITDLVDDVDRLLDDKNLSGLATALVPVDDPQLVGLLERLAPRRRAITYRLLHKDRALAAFEALSPSLQGELIQALQDSEVAAIFAGLDPDDRVWLLDELPAALAPLMLQGLSQKERQLTAGVLGYAKGSVGRRMSPEYLSTRADATVAETLARLRERIDEVETAYTVPVVDPTLHVIGVVSLRDLMRAEPEARIDDIMTTARVAVAYEDAEIAARRCADHRLLALPVVDNEDRLVGIFTIDDAVRILEFEESEDAARQGGVEPLRRPYLSTPINRLVRSRVVWLLVLAVGATLTVQVLSVFEDTLAEVTVLALFVPLLIGTGGNTGNQAATTVTRALALDDVRPRDVWSVLTRELRVGLCLGALLGGAGGLITGLLYQPRIGLVIGLTLLAVCTMAAAVGGVMPVIARTLRVDPAVFSNPFITTFIDATGLVIYFLVARAVLGL